MTTTTMKLPKQYVRGQFVPKSYDAANRTIDIRFTTGARTLKNDMFGEPFNEELVVTPEACDLTRLEAGRGVPLLDNHAFKDGRPWRESVRTILGRSQKAWITPPEGWARFRFGKRQEIAGLIEDILDGTIVDVSVGYIPMAAERVEDVSEPIPLIRITRWQVMEVSMTTVPADGDSQVRSDSPEFFEIEVRSATQVSPAAPGGHQQEATQMPIPATQGGDQTPAAVPVVPAPEVRTIPAAAVVDAAQIRTLAAPIVDAAQIRNQATLDERNRQNEIRAAVRAANLGNDTADNLINEGTDIHAARAAVIAKLAENQASINPAHATSVTVTRDAGDTMIRGMQGAILLRLDPSAKLEQADADMLRPYRYQSMLRMAEQLLDATGRNVAGMSKHQIAAMAMTRGGMHSTSDFPYLLANAANKRLRAVYQESPSTYQRWAKRAPNAPDFKTISVVNLGAVPNLVLRNEGGETKYGTMGEGREQYQVLTYTGGLGFTREAMINDDLRGFDRVVTGFANASRRKENALVYGILTANANMADGNALFSAAHLNVSGGAGAISVTTLGTGRATMRIQTGLAGEVLNLTPAFLIVPATIEQVAYQFTSAQYVPAQSSNINEFRAGGRTALEPIVEAVLDATSTSVWYMAHDGSACDTIEYCWLDGAEGAYVESEMDFNTDGLKIKARLDFGCKAIDWRGLYRNAA